MKASSYADYRRQHYWRENSLAFSDEDESLHFDWKLVKSFGPYLARYKGAALLSVLLMLVYILLNLSNPYLIGLAIDRFITNHDLNGLAIMSVILLVLNIAMWQAQYWQVWTMSWAGQQILYHLSSDMFAHLQWLSLSFYDHTQIGRVMSRLQSDVDVLEGLLSSGLLSIMSSLLALIGIIVAMLAMNVKLARRVPAAVTLDTVPLTMDRQRRQRGLGGWKRTAAHQIHHRALRAAAPAYRVWLPMTSDCAQSLQEDYGVQPGRCRVTLNPQDVDWWTPPPRRLAPPWRLLFVGNDFQRKGGDRLMRLCSHHFSGGCTWTIVSND